MADTNRPQISTIEDMLSRLPYELSTGVTAKREGLVNMLKDALVYNKDTGEFTWRTDRSSNAKQGDKAGSTNSHGYRQITLSGRTYLLHKVVWLFERGEWPTKEVDHINGIRDDNRIENLRVVTRRENAQNKPNHRSGRLPGATYSGGLKKPWRAKASINGSYIHLGYFHTEHEAHEAYKEFVNGIQ